MELVRTEDAVGSVLCHDITQIISGKKKGPVFRKGHVIQPEDIAVLLSVGKEHLYVWEKQQGILHEDEAAEILRDLCLNEGMRATEPKEGKIDLIAECDGLFQVDGTALLEVNSTPQMMIATRHGNTFVKAGDKLAGTRIIPLVIEEEKMRQVQNRTFALTGGKPVLRLLPYRHKKIGIVVTGSEVFKGRIQDTFTSVLLHKLQEFDTEVIGHAVCDDDDRMTTKAINEFLKDGADVVLCTGGMSVDPDDKTPLAIRNTGAEVVTYGAPVLPGAMFMLAYLGKAAICGLPGCVMYAKRTIFDLMLPRVLAEDKITAKEIAALGEGGLCLECGVCTYPNCGFGK
ncbi:molybdopterin-binding protein [Clostridium minihomine]|uniref:molybdopterin-binding protein n=1 Tax=Clostridium minihomine TaxID=2045012 RepID=UPI000C77A4C1|nr:molybdopterin-binding protein [Clostridium minihomine]